MRSLVEALAKRLRALRLGVLFGRTRDFHLPDRVQVGGHWHTTKLSDEHGVEVAFRELLFADCYGLSAVPQTLRTVLDVGGNVGLFAIAARQRFPDATIHCYEPNPALAPYLRVQAAAATATVFMEAVGAVSGYVSLDFGTESVLTSTHADAAGPIICTGITEVLDRLAPNGGTVDLVKLDGEGVEWELLRDPAPWQRVHHLTMEYHLEEGRTTDAMVALVEGAGFRIRHLAPSERFGLLRAER